MNDSVTTSEDGPARTIQVLSNDLNPDGGPKLVVAKTNGARGKVAIINGGSRVTYLPNANFCGNDSFTYTLNGGSSATVAVGVTCVDDLPVAVDDTRAMTEDGGATQWAVMNNDPDIDGGKTIVAVGTAAHGTVSITSYASRVTYQPAVNFCGADSFTYTLNGGSTATVSVTVTCVDDPPVAIPDNKRITEDAPAAPYAVMSNDTDVDGGPAKTIVSATNGSLGTVTVTHAGTKVTYAPKPNACGTDAFTYTLNGGSTAVVTMTVTCVADPDAVADSAFLDQGGSILIDVLGNDLDIDAGSTGIVDVSASSHGAVTVESDGLRYTPTSDFCGSDYFTYTLTGGSSALVYVGTRCPPGVQALAVDDDVSVAAGTYKVILNVLANDLGQIGGGISEWSEPSHGSIEPTPDDTTAARRGQLDYYPDPGFCGTDTFSYTLVSGSTANVTVTVTCGAGPPAVEFARGATGFKEDGPPVVVDPYLRVTDPDDTQLLGATVWIHPDDIQPADELLFATPHQAIAGAYDATTATLTFTGTASIAEYESVLRGVSFTTDVNLRTSTKRIFFLVEADGEQSGSTAHKLIKINFVNDKPWITSALTTPLAYEAGKGPAVVDPTLTVGVEDLFINVVVRISSGFVSAQDELTLLPDVTGMGVAATYDDSTGTMTVTAPLFAYDAVLRSIAYEYAPPRPGTVVTRTVTFTVRDHNGTSAVSRTIEIR